MSSFGSTNAVWIPLGPRATGTAAGVEQDYGPAVGRITAIAVDPGDPTGNTVYVGGAYGGLWRSRNAADASTMSCPAGSNAKCASNLQWEPLLDDQPTLAVGAIAVHPENPNWILVGTGEAHNAADSYYGMGILLSKDGGASWALKDETLSGAPLRGLGITRIVFNTDNPNIVVATAAAASAGVRLGAEAGGAAARGIYYSHDGGETWQKATVQDPGGAVTGASANSVIYNSVTHTFYANLRFHGFYSSTNGTNWTRLSNQPGGALLNLAACPTQASSGCPLFRAEMTVVPGRDEMYVWIVDANSANRGIFQTRDGGATPWAAVPVTSMEECGDVAGCGAEQGVYNLTLAAVPDGSITDLYAGAVNLFKCRLTSLSDPTSCVFANLTHAYGCAPAGSYAHVHPSQHAIAFSPQAPQVLYFGNDGGLYRTRESFALNSGTCGDPPVPAWFQNLNFSAVPNAGLGSMLQFVSLAQHPTDASILLGGTQDNGSPSTSSASAGMGVWLAANRGDGGSSAINPNDGDEWFTSTPGGTGSGFSVDIQRCALGTNCTPEDFRMNRVVGLAQTGGDASSYYPPFLFDPQMPNRLIAGTCRVWRGNSDGTGEWGTPGTPLSINFAADSAGSFASTACSPSHTMLASLAAGGPVSPGVGSRVVWAGQEGNGADSGGELWVSLNADTGPSSWRRALSANTMCSGTAFNPRHYTVSDIALDPSDGSGRTAYVGVMGFTDGASGHVFKVQVDDSSGFSSTCTDISGNLPDVPADSVVIHPASPTSVYVGTDAGVFVTNSAGAGAIWDEVGPSGGPGALPNVVVTRLKIFAESGGGLKLRAATYGRGLWEASLTPDLHVVLNGTAVHAFPGVSRKFEGKLFALAGYNNPVTITCENTGSGLPSICNSTGGLAPSSTGTPFDVVVENPTVQDFSFNLKATGTDGTTHSYPVTVYVGDFHVSGSSSTLDVPRGTTANRTIALSTSGTVNTGINLSCGLASGGPLPLGITCTLLPATLTLSGSGSSSIVQVGATQNAAIGSHPLRVTVTSADSTRTKSYDFTVSVQVNPRFELQASSSALGTVKPGQPLSANLSLQSLDGYPNATVNLGCQLSGNAGTAACQVSPGRVNLQTGGTQQVTVTVDTAGALAGDSSVTITGTDGTKTASATLSFTVQDYRLEAPVLELIPGGSGTVALTVTSEQGYSGSVVVTCDSGSFAGNTCLIQPAGPVAIASGGIGTRNLTVTAPVNTSAGSHSVLLKTHDTSLPNVVRQTAMPVKVYDYRLSTSSSNATIPAGQSATLNVALTSGADPFPQKVTFACSGLPQLASCTFSSSELPAGIGSGTVQVTILTTAVTVAGGASRTPGNSALAWLGMAVLGLVVSGAKLPRRRVSWLVLLLAGGLASCGGGGSGNGVTPPIPQPGTPSGTYTITIQGSTVGSLGAAERSTRVTLIVQ